MDYIRTCYRVQMRLGPGRDPVWVQWYWAPGGALTMPLWHPFGSRDWENRNGSVLDTGLGELAGARVYADGSVPATGYGLLGDQRSRDCAQEHAVWWEGGFAPPAESGPYDAQGRPECCLPRPDSPCQPCPCTDLTLNPTPDPAQWAAACFYLGPTMNWTKDGDCHWSGEWFTWSGNFLQRMYFTAGQWHWEIDTSPQCHFIVSGDTCEPVTIDYPVPSINTQPFALGIPCAGDIILRFKIND